MSVCKHATGANVPSAADNISNVLYEEISLDNMYPPLFPLTLINNLPFIKSILFFIRSMNSSLHSDSCDKICLK